MLKVLNSSLTHETLELNMATDWGMLCFIILFIS